MEEGLTKDIFFHPQHPYTQHLIECIPARVKVIARKHVEETGSINLIHDADEPVEAVQAAESSGTVQAADLAGTVENGNSSKPEGGSNG